MNPKSNWLLGAVTLALALVVATWQTIPGSATTATPTADPCTTTGQGQQNGSMMTPGTGMGMTTPGSGMNMMGEFDLMFIDMMIPHHESAVVMAQVALTRAEHEEIRQLAEDIIASQSAEIAQMREWRSAWYGNATAMPMDQMLSMMGGMMHDMTGMGGMDQAAMMAMMMDADREVQALCAASGSFDLAFIAAMIPHHQSAILMARVALQNGTHQEIKDLAQAIVDTQQREIGEMEGWRASWSSGTPTAG